FWFLVLGSGKELARPEGVEPPAYRFEACRSIQLSYGRARRVGVTGTPRFGCYHSAPWMARSRRRLLRVGGHHALGVAVAAEAQEDRREHERRREEERRRHADGVERPPVEERRRNPRDAAEGLLQPHVKPALDRRDHARQQGGDARERERSAERDH